MTARPFRLTAPAASEAQTLRAVLHALTLHPKVCRVWRANSGAGKLTWSSGHQSQFMRFGFKGQPDVLGFTTAGRLLACEVKAVGKHPTPEQQEFLDDVAKAGGIAFVARDVADVFAQLGPL
jgi:hypothetical protein